MSKKINVVKSDLSHARLDTESRVKKAEIIISIIKSRVKLDNAVLLDIGTGAGTIASLLGTEAKKVTSVDIFDERVDRRNYEFVKVKNEALPFENDSFDFVISNHVIEHTPDRAKHIAEALRVLKRGGYLYVATPNRWWLTDPHYRLFFVSWLSRGMADKYLKFRRGSEKKWDIYPTSHYFLKSKTKEHSLSPLLSDMVQQLAESKPTTMRLLLSRVSPKLLNRLQIFSPTLVYLVKK